MITTIKSLAVLCVSVLLVLSCSKSDIEPVPVPVKTIYRLTLISKNSENPTTGTMTWNNVDGKMQSETFLSDQNVSFAISKGYNVYYKITGTYNSTAKPTSTLSYSVERFDNGVSQGFPVISSSTVPVAGIAGRWTLDGIINCTFDGTACK